MESWSLLLSWNLRPTFYLIDFYSIYFEKWFNRSDEQKFWIVFQYNFYILWENGNLFWLEIKHWPLNNELIFQKRGFNDKRVFVLAFHFGEVLFYNTYMYFIYVVDFPTCLTRTPCLKHFFKISECLSSCYRNWEWYVSKRHTMSQAKNRKLDSGNDFRTTAFRTLSVLAAPVMYLFYKFHESSKRDPVFVRKPNTEKELEHLNKRIVSRVLI